MTMGRKAALAAATAVMFMGVANVAQAAPPASEYVMKAGASDLYEKKSSQLVLGSTKNSGVRKFANMMVTDHGKSTMMVKTAAMKAGMHPAPPMLDSKQQGMMSELMAAKGADRDRMYVDQQKAAHQEALSLQQDYASSGDTPSLRMAAGKIVPVVQQHIAMLNAMPSM